MIDLTKSRIHDQIDDKRVKIWDETETDPIKELSVGLYYAGRRAMWFVASNFLGFCSVLHLLDLVSLLWPFKLTEIRS